MTPRDATGQCFAVVMLCKAMDAFWFQKIVLRQQRASWAALAAALPIMLLNLVLPFLLPCLGRCDVGVPAHASAVLAWICNFKVLAYVSGRGPSYNKSMNFWEVFACLVTPATIAFFPAGNGAAARKKTDDPTPQPAGPVASGHRNVALVTEGPLPRAAIIRAHLKLLLLYGLLLAAVRAALRYSRTAGLPGWAVQALYGIGFLAFHLFTHVPWEMVSSLLCRRPAVHNAWRPWAPRSVADFWGARWNRTGSDLHRWVIYEPLVTGIWRLPPGADQRALLRCAPAWRRALGVLCTFAVSGLAHELIWASMVGSPLWWFLAYFLANGAVVVAEGLVRQWLFRRLGAVGSSSGKGGAAQASSLAGNGKKYNGSTNRSRAEKSTTMHQAAISLKTNGATSPHSSALAATPRGLLLQLLCLAARVAQSAAVFAVVMGLGGWLVWPRLAPAIGEKFLGVPGMSFGQLHAHLFL